MLRASHDEHGLQSRYRSAVRRIRRTQRFIRAERSSDLLTCLAGHALRGSVPSEWEIATEVFGRGPDWTNDDPIVRVNLKRLRESLADYYANEGASDPVILDVAVRRVIANYREQTRVIASPFLESFDRPILAAGDAFFALPEDSVMRCVVTGATAEVAWHHLDGDPFNFSAGNLVPLSRRLRSHIAALRQGRRSTASRELDPRRLGSILAPDHFQGLRPARAYGCAALAFYMGSAPLGHEPDHLRAIWVCDAIQYARRHFYAPLLRHALHQMALPFLTRLDSIDAAGALRFAIQLTALMEEIGHYDDAETCLAFANHVSRVAGQSSFGAGSQESFGLFRRRAQLMAERMPDDAKFDGLLARAQEHANDVPERIFSLHIVRAHRWLRQGSPEGLRRAYEALAEIADASRPSLVHNGAITPPKRIAAHIGELLLLSGIASCRLRPTRWKSYAEETITSAKTLIHLAGHVLPSEYRVFASNTIRKHNANSAPLLRLSPSQLRPPPPDELSATATLVLKCLARLRVLRIHAPTSP